MYMGLFLVKQKLFIACYNNKLIIITAKVKCDSYFNFIVNSLRESRLYYMPFLYFITLNTVHNFYVVNIQ